MFPLNEKGDIKVDTDYNVLVISIIIIIAGLLYNERIHRAFYGPGGLESILQNIPWYVVKIAIVLLGLIFLYYAFIP